MDAGRFEGRCNAQLRVISGTMVRCGGLRVMWHSTGESVIFRTPPPRPLAHVVVSRYRGELCIPDRDSPPAAAVLRSAARAPFHARNASQAFHFESLPMVNQWVQCDEAHPHWGAQVPPAAECQVTDVWAGLHLPAPPTTTHTSQHTHGS